MEEEEVFSPMLKFVKFKESFNFFLRVRAFVAANRVGGRYSYSKVSSRFWSVARGSERVPSHHKSPNVKSLGGCGNPRWPPVYRQRPLSPNLRSLSPSRTPAGWRRPDTSGRSMCRTDVRPVEPTQNPRT